MDLLNPTPPSELPAEALLARVRSRRALLGVGTGFQGDRTLPPEQQLQDVLDWIFLKLDRRLRRLLTPYLEILAMRQLILLLRYRMVGDPPPPVLLRSRLLDPALITLIRVVREPVQMIIHLESALVDACPFLSGLQRAFLQQGPGGVELQLAKGILQQSLDKAQDGVVQWLVRYLIDMRNLLTVFKLWRWNVHRPPALVSGGRWDPEVLLRAWQHHDRKRLLRWVGQLGEVREFQETFHQVEWTLLNGITRCLQRARRDPLGIAVVLDYLWRCQLIACNQALQWAVGEERPELLAEALLT